MDGWVDGHIRWIDGFMDDTYYGWMSGWIHTVDGYIWLMDGWIQ